MRQFLLISVCLVASISHLKAEINSNRTEQVLRSTSWFYELPERYQQWLMFRANNFKSEFPRKVEFTSLDNPLNVYSTPDSKSVIATIAPALVIPFPDNGGDYAGPGQLEIYAITGDMLEVTHNDVRGWIRRSSIRFPSIIMAKKDGSYVGDLPDDIVPHLIGMACDKSIPVLIFNWSGATAIESEPAFGFQYDPQTQTVSGAVQWSLSSKKLTETKRLNKIIDEATYKKLKAQIGLEKYGFVKKPDGTIADAYGLNEPLNGSMAALSCGDYLFITEKWLARE